MSSNSNLSTPAMLLHIFVVLLFDCQLEMDAVLSTPTPCRIAELDTLNKSLFNADFWTNISTGHSILHIKCITKLALINEEHTRLFHICFIYFLSF